MKNCKTYGTFLKALTEAKSCSFAVAESMGNHGVIRRNLVARNIEFTETKAGDVATFVVVFK